MLTELVEDLNCEMNSKNHRSSYESDAEMRPSLPAFLDDNTSLTNYDILANINSNQTPSASS